MTDLVVQWDTGAPDLAGEPEQGELYANPVDSPAVRISNPDRENGYPVEAGPLSWLNSARLTVDPEDDALHCVVSVGDPRGGFGFTVRRLRDGRLVIHVPHPEDGTPHMATRWINPGTLEVGTYGKPYGENVGRAKAENWPPMFAGPADFTDEDTEEEGAA